MKYRFNGKYPATDKQRFKKAQEYDLLKIATYLETDTPKLNKIIFKVFDTKEAKQKHDPLHSISRASARYHEFAIYRHWEPDDNPHFPHETTHLVAHTWSKPYFWIVELDTADGGTIKVNVEMQSTSFMQEGLAIAVDELVFNRKLYEHGERKFPDEWCIEKKQGFPRLKEAINFDGFCSFDNKVVVPFAASLSKYLLDKHGLKLYREMYIKLKEINTPNKNVNILEETYGRTEVEIIKGWKNSIGLS